MKKKLFLAMLMSIMLILLGISAGADSKRSHAANNVVKVYGPGGPLGPIKELAGQFTEKTGIEVEVTAGPEAKWIDQAKHDADIIYGGSEYMLTDFMLKHPGIINGKTRTELYTRAAGILVRKGNPKQIQSLEDLTKPGVKIIDVNGAGQLGLWEDLAGRKGLIPGISNNIAVSVKSSAEAIELWNANSKFDAWITYESWHYRLSDVTELVQFPEEEKLYRGTPISLTTETDNRKESKQFIEFLKTEQSHQVFQQWGWK
ncbi:extracellular solute-binding protein [Bacillus sp. FSL K6-3431]|uniref:extracellular solute-binding protein n=1 Tax=Bacillus sp. FSL K6-3431 TaxID=2921500 RepID=UPI0030F6C66E